MVDGRRRSRSRDTPGADALTFDPWTAPVGPMVTAPTRPALRRYPQSWAATTLLAVAPHLHDTQQQAGRRLPARLSPGTAATAVADIYSATTSADSPSATMSSMPPMCVVTSRAPSAIASRAVVGQDRPLAQQQGARRMAASQTAPARAPTFSSFKTASGSDERSMSARPTARSTRRSPGRGSRTPPPCRYALCSDRSPASARLPSSGGATCWGRSRAGKYGTKFGNDLSATDALPVDLVGQHDESARTASNRSTTLLRTGRRDRTSDPMMRPRPARPARRAFHALPRCRSGAGSSSFMSRFVARTSLSSCGRSTASSRRATVNGR